MRAMRNAVSSFKPIGKSVSLLALVLALSVAGCKNNGSVTGLSPKEGARRIAKLRNDADACFSEFQQSEGRDLEKLECFTESHYQTTQIRSAPDCPLCYLNYGRGLRLLGDYQRTLLRAIEARLDEAPLDEVDALEARATEVHQQIQSYFKRSTEILEIYLRVPGRSIRDVHYWLSDNYAELGDYEKAARQIEAFIKLVKSDASAAELRHLNRQLRRYEALRENQIQGRDR